MKHKIRILVVFIILWCVGCAPVPVQLGNYNNVALEIADTLNKITKRYSGTEQIQLAELFISQYMSGLGCTVTTKGETMPTSPTSSVTLYNIVCSFYPENKHRVMLYTNYDQNPLSGDSTDCGSGVALLLSLSNYIAENKPDVGVDVVFFDGRYAFDNREGINSHLRYCLGSQAWAKRYSEKSSRYDYGISVSHPATKNTVFPIDGNSNHFASRHFYFAKSTAKLFNADTLFPDAIVSPYYGDNTIVSTLGGVHSFNLAGCSVSGSRAVSPKNDNIQDIDNQRFEIIAKIILETLYTNH